MSTTLQSVNLKATDYLGDLGVDGRLNEKAIEIKVPNTVGWIHLVKVKTSNGLLGTLL
jgi:hypothetical protein